MRALTKPARIEQFSAFTPDERIFSYVAPNERFFEVGLHLLPDASHRFVQEAFVAFAKTVEVKLHKKLGLTAGNLWFVPVEGKRSQIERLAEFVFVRVIRPKLRGIRPVQRSGEVTVSCSLPTEQPLSSEPRVAILDGGLPKQHPIGPWLRAYRQVDEDAEDDPAGIQHGLAVSSAFLSGETCIARAAPTSARG